ncbi:GNAT family N-acetyltransferase [Streptacidiphilus rugosus]|uniref:GNAT family N-acetyltransferase n=1 Tax=Streptacidiphilus rugosus TaxID=405783 RepID=UPI00055DE8AF|nr:GNAT family N-acetyltransferase [Streptacidiphilus rugosus]
MSFEIELFSPLEASNGDLRECYQVIVSVVAEEFPEQPIPTFDAYVGQMRTGTSLLGERSYWVAREQGEILGVATLELPAFENSDVAVVTVRVRPTARRRGIGRALLRTAIAQARTESRGLLNVQSVKVDGEGERWATKLGFETVQSYVLQRLEIAAVEPRLWQVSVPDGFRLQHWSGRAPHELVAAYALARTAIADAPLGDSEFKFPEWTVDRVRQHEAEIEERGDIHWVVVAVCERSGAVAGLTEMLFTPHRPGLGLQQETAVPPAFRGQGLGQLVKAEMMQWVTRQRPEIHSIVTNTAADNTYMIRVNRQIGYATDCTVADMEARVEGLSI